MAWAGRHRAVVAVLVVVLGVGVIAAVDNQPDGAEAVAVDDVRSPTPSSAPPTSQPDRTTPPSPSPSPTRTPSPRPSTPASSPSPTATEATEPEPSPTPEATSAGPRGDQAPVVVQGRAADVVDGDTIDLANGTRIRLAIVDTPEVHGGMEPCGPEASDFTARFVAGQTVAVYRPPGAPQTDSYGRTLGEVVRVSDGASLNVALVRSGLGTIDDRFTHEDRDLADRLAAAAAVADSPSCAPQAQPAVPVTGAHTGKTDGGWTCHPAYQECLPQVGDLDCADVGHQVTLLGGDDPYRLDGRSTSRDDGLGCESFGSWSPAQTYPYY